MKIINVTGDSDFNAVYFENENAGKTIAELLVTLPESDEYECGVIDVGEVSNEFRKFIRDNQDYDSSKCTNFYFEDETLPIR